MNKSKNIEYILLSSIILGVGLIPLFNDFPLFGGSHFFRNASYIGIIFSFIIVIPLAFSYKFKLDNFVKIYLTFALSGIFLFIILFLINYSFYEMYSGREFIAFIVFIKTLLTLSALVFISAILVVFMNSCSSFMVIKSLINGCFFATVFAVMYGLLELMAQYHLTSFALPIYNFLDYLLHDHENDYFGKFVVRSLAFEPSYLSLPIAFLLPIALLRKKLCDGFKSNSIIAGLIFLSIISGSRTGYVVTIMQLIVAFIFSKNFPRRKRTFKIYWFLLLLVGIVSIAYETLISILIINETSISNVERMGSWIASLFVFLDNPFIGVGFGLSGGFLFDHYPDFFYLSYSASKWADYSDQFGSSVFALLPRIIAELGIIGFGFILTPLLFLVYFILQIRNYAFMNNKFNIFHLSNCILLIWVGLSIGSFGVDSMVFPGYWLLLSISIWFVIKFRKF
jgi:hypothetical protein